MHVMQIARAYDTSKDNTRGKKMMSRPLNFHRGIKCSFEVALL